jgi:hypothetical protein
MMMIMFFYLLKLVVGGLGVDGIVIEQAVKIFHVPRVWRFAAGESTARSAVWRAKPAAKRAFRSGIVRN